MYAVWQGVFGVQKITEETILPWGRKVWASLDAGIDGFVLEGAWDSEDGSRLLEAGLEQVGGMAPVVVKLDGLDTAAVVGQARLAEKYGVDGLVAALPLGFTGKPVDFFKSVAGATGLPLMIDGREASMGVLEELARVETIQAVKVYVGDMTEMVSRWGHRFRFLCGEDRTALEGLTSGALGWMANVASIFPEEVVAVYRLVCAGRVVEAEEIYRWLMEVGRVIDRRPVLPDYLSVAGAVA